MFQIILQPTEYHCPTMVKSKCLVRNFKEVSLCCVFESCTGENCEDWHFMRLLFPIPNYCRSKYNVFLQYKNQNVCSMHTFSNALILSMLKMRMFGHNECKNKIEWCVNFKEL